MSNRSLTDKTQDSDSCNVGSIPAGCILSAKVSSFIILGGSKTNGKSEPEKESK